MSEWKRKRKGEKKKKKRVKQSVNHILINTYIRVYNIYVRNTFTRVWFSSIKLLITIRG